MKDVHRMPNPLLFFIFFSCPIANELLYDPICLALLCGALSQIGNTRIRSCSESNPAGRDQLHYSPWQHSQHWVLPPGPGKSRADLPSLAANHSQSTDSLSSVCIVGLARIMDGQWPPLKVADGSK